MRVFTLALATLLACSSDDAPTDDAPDVDMMADDTMADDGGDDPNDDGGVDPSTGDSQPEPPGAQFVHMRFANMSRFLDPGVDVFIDQNKISPALLGPLTASTVRTGAQPGILPGLHEIGFAVGGDALSTGWTSAVDFLAGYYTSAVFGEPPNVQIDIAAETTTGWLQATCARVSSTRSTQTRSLP